MKRRRPPRLTLRSSGAVLCVLFWCSAATAESIRSTRLARNSLPAAADSVPVGRTDPKTPIEVVVGLGWERPQELESLVRDLANPQSARFGHFLSPEQFATRFAPSEETLDAVASFLAANGMQVTAASPSRTLVTARGTAAAAERAFSVRLNDVWLHGRRRRRASRDPSVPVRLAGRVLSLQGLDEPIDLEPPHGGPVIPPEPGAPFQPADIARLYEFEPLYGRGYRGNTTRGSTIAVATAFGFDPADLERFWKQFRVARNLASIELIPVRGPIREVHSETVLDVEWASAMAPGAPILVYAGADASSSTFLQVYDRIVSDNRAAVLTTSWGRCEEDLPQSYLQQVDAIFQRAAAQGITVLAASGDAGAFGCGGEQPGVSFPASSPYALAVGGTTAHLGKTSVNEMAWEGSGGGSSVKWPAPAWQMQPYPYRVMADVALNADPETPYLTAYEGDWWYFGGTSVGAPIWAALVALTNQLRAARGRPTLGLAAPALCEVAHARDLDDEPLRDITRGHNQIYAAQRGWDFPTGWGTPRVALLAETLATWTPSAACEGGQSEAIVLRPAGFGAVAGSARLRFRRRCLSTAVSLRMRGATQGTYTLELDGARLASFEVDGRGRAAVELTNLDPRGGRIAISDGEGTERFGGGFIEVAEPSVQLAIEMMSIGAAQQARGTIFYRSSAGREELSVWTRDLPPGSYEVRIGEAELGRFVATGAGRSILVRFGSVRSGSELPVSPHCRSVSVTSSGKAYLRSKATALSAGGCGS